MRKRKGKGESRREGKGEWNNLFSKTLGAVITLNTNVSTSTSNTKITVASNVVLFQPTTSTLH
jgi:hypothetical protein